MSDFKKILLLLQLRRNAWRKTEDLLKIQERKLRAMIKYAYENVRFYHEKFDSFGFKPSDFKTVDDLKKLPLTTKQEVRDNYPNKIVARGFSVEKLKKYRTSGSTGIPLSVVLDRNAEDYRAALFGRPFLECGLKLRDKMVEIIDPRNLPKRKKWYQNLGLLRRFYVSASQDVRCQLPLITAYDPDAIFGYPSWLCLLARLVHRSRDEQQSPRLVFSTGEILTEEQRRIIETSFETEVFDFYGCVEVERVAWECGEHMGYHCDVDSVVTEIVRNNEEVSPGERGTLILTSLYNYAMPLIRYNIEDIAVPTNEKCACGRGLPLIREIEGRADDMVIAPSGKIIVPENFAQIMRAIQGIGQYKVIQERKDLIVVQLVAGQGFSQKTIEKMVEELKKIIGHDIDVRTLIIDKIEKENSGKVRAVISKVPLRL